VTMLHQDDVWLTGSAARLATGPTSGLYLTSARFLSPTGTDLGPWSLPLGAPDRADDDVVAHLLVQNFVCIAAPVFDRVVALDTGGLDEDLWYTADWDLWLRLAALGPVSHTPEATVGFRVHGESQTATRTADLADMRAQLATVRDRHWASWAAKGPARQVSRVRRASDAAMDVNVALAGAASRQLGAVPAALRSLLLLGPAWSVFWRSSRLRERVGARLRARR